MLVKYADVMLGASHHVKSSPHAAMAQSMADDPKRLKRKQTSNAADMRVNHHSFESMETYPDSVL